VKRHLIDRLLELWLRMTVASAARVVTDPVRLASNELFLRRRVRSYRLRGSGWRIFIRHPMSDAWVVHEVLGRSVYRPPAEVRRVIGASPSIVDLGAHVGAATLLFLEAFPEAAVVAVEPNPQTAALLRRTIEANALGPRCEVREAAAGVAAGSATIDGFSLLSHLVRDGVEEAVDHFPFLRRYQDPGAARSRVEVIDVLPLLERADLVKMDIEGAEWPILQDPRLAQTPLKAIVLEYHPQGAPEADTTGAVRKALQTAGFTVGEPFDQHHGVGLVWAWRE
jgi:FkbM family methyltransferase